MGSRRIETDSIPLVERETVKTVDDVNGGDYKSKTSSSAVSSFGQFFQKMCGFYMSIGMTYEEYWHGANDAPKYYLEAYERRMKDQNTMLWLQGFYVYDALTKVYGVFNPAVKKPKVEPYRDKPVSLFENDNEYESENYSKSETDTRNNDERNRQREESKDSRNYMQEMMRRVNGYYRTHSK